MNSQIFTRFLVSMAVVFYSGRVFSTEVVSEEQNLKAQMLTPIHTFDGTQGHLFHDGYLWVSHGDRGQVAVYDADGGLVKTINLPNRPGVLERLDDHSVIAVGYNGTTLRTGYTVITHSHGEFRTNSYNFSVEVVVENFAGNRQQMYFTEQSEHRIDLLTSAGIRPLPVQLRIPRKMIFVEGLLYIIDTNNADYKLLKVSPSSAVSTPLISTTEGMLSNLLYLPNLQTIAVTDPEAGKVHYVKTGGSSPAKTLEIAGGPRSVAQLGKCLLIGTDESRKIHFYDMTAETPKPVGVWDLAFLGPQLKRANALAVDPASRHIFVRSTYPCPGCAATESSVWLLEEITNETLDVCR